MLNFLYGILLIVVVLPNLQAATSLIVTLLDYWETIIAAKTVRIRASLERESAEMQLDLQDRQMANQEHSPAIGFQFIDSEALGMEEE
jgi:hypothetical protein